MANTLKKTVTDMPVPETGRHVQDELSMSRRANAWGNAPMESFFKTLKVERIYQTRYETRAQARWISATGSRAIAIANACIPQSTTSPPSNTRPG